ncbi:phage baseplate assembly protein V [Aeromonas finlandensis]|uniref:phage baseplate assembly protein V n=1 Tax=Aeromonas finlandensis TaxID=1543375 RepID=UPI0009DE1E7D|nr:phage baseplate assembly protein V [Aeromonas finlandensis]
MRELKNAIRNLLSRGVIRLVNSAAKCQLVQIEMLGGELKDDVEHLEPYGFTSCPHDGAEHVAVFPDGDKSHGVVLVVADRRYRLKGLAAGEVALYTDEGDRIVLRRGRRIEVKTLTLEVEAKTKARFDTPLLECTGEIRDKTGTMQKMRD